MNNDNFEEIKRALDNPALLPSYRQVLEKRLRELSKDGQPPAPEAPKPTVTEKRTPYAGVSNMTTEEIIHYYSTGQFFRLDQPISGLEALCSVYRIFGICGKERETVARVAEAIERMGGDVPEMIQIDVSDLLKRQ